MTNKTMRLTGSVFLLIITVFASSCRDKVQMMDPEIMNMVNDENAPVIEIISPEAGSSYSSTVIVEGQVTDAAAKSGGDIESFSYKVLDTAVEDDIAPSEGGAFSFSFKTKSDSVSMSGQITIELTATDWNGNTGRILLTLDDNGAFSNFSVYPEDGSVRVEWSDIPDADSYTLLYTRDGAEPKENNGSSVDMTETMSIGESGLNSFTLDNLENGELYRFKVMGICSDGEKNFSGVKDAIPLTTRHLCPELRAGDREIKLIWQSVPGTENYRVYRSNSEDGEYDDVSGIVRTTELTDSNLTAGKTYYYRIAPDLPNSVLSERASATPYKRSILPYRAGSASAEDALMDICIKEDYAYAVDRTAGLAVYSIRNPASPSLVGTYGRDGYDYSLGRIKIQGDYLYMSGMEESYGTEHLLVYSLVSSSSPVFLGDCHIGGMNDFEPYGDYLYVSGSAIIDFTTFQPQGTITVVDISSPESINDASVLATVIDPTKNNSYDGIDIYDDKIYLSGDHYMQGKGLCVYDISSDPETPESPVNYGSSYSQRGDVLVRESNGAIIAYLMGGNSHFERLDVTNTGSISLSGSYNDAAMCTGLAVSDKYAFISSNLGSLTILGLDGDDGEVSENFRIVTGGQPQSVALQDAYAFVADGTGGLVSIHAGHLETAPSQSGGCNAPYPSQLALNGDYAYVAGGTDGIGILKIYSSGVASLSDTFTPDFANPNSMITDVEVQGDYLYAACYPGNGTGDPGIYIYDVSNPASPVLISSSLTLIRKLEVRGFLAYAISGSYFYILDTEAPASPSLLNGLSVSGAYDIRLSGDYAFVACSNSSDGLVVIDISNPDYPKKVGSCQTGPAIGSDMTVNLSISGGYAYIAKERLYIVEISDPRNLNDADLIGDYYFWEDTGKGLYGVDSDDRYVYVTTAGSGDEGLTIIDARNPESPCLLSEPEIGDGNSFCELDGNYLYVGDTQGSIEIYHLQE